MDNKVDRVVLAIQAGETGKHVIEWTKDGHPPGYGCLGSLDWRAVVLDDLTIDLEVSVRLRTRKKGEIAGVRILQEGGAQSRSFQGKFNPADDPRLKGEEGDESRHEVA